MSSLSDYIQRVNTFVGILKASPAMVADLYNTMSNAIDPTRENLDAEEDADVIADIITDNGIETLTRKQQEAKLLENGWEPEEVAETMQQDLVAMDDSYRRTFLLNITDPNSPIVVNLCEFPAFAEKCSAEGYVWDGVMTWKALQEFATTFGATGHIVVTQDAEVISFPLPEVTAGGRRKKRGRTARRRQSSKKATRKH